MENEPFSNIEVEFSILNKQKQKVKVQFQIG